MGNHNEKPSLHFNDDDDSGICCWWFLLSVPAAAQSTPSEENKDAASHVSFKVPSREFKNAVGASAVDLSATSVLKTGLSQPDFSPSKNFSRVRGGAFSLLPVSGGNTGGRFPGDTSSSLIALRNSLRLLPGKTEQFVKLQRCTSLISCADIGEVRVGEQNEISLNGLKWKFVSLAPLCIDVSKKCEANLPAWSLAKRARFSDGSLASFPSLAVVAQSADGVVVTDATTGEVWDEISLPAGTDLGNLQSARVFSQGSLVLMGDKASILLNYSSDFALYFDSEGVAKSDLGIADLGSSRWVRSFEVPSAGGERPKLLAIAPEFVVFNQGVLNFSSLLSGGTSFKFEKLGRGILAANVDERKEQGKQIQNSYVVLRLLQETDDGVSLTTRSLRRSRSSVADIQNFPVHSKNVLSYRLMNNSVLQLTTGGVYMLSSSGEKSTSLTGQTGDIQTDGQFGAAVKIQTGEKCKWRHFLQNESKPFSFSETGLEWSCQSQTPRLMGTPSSSLAVWPEGRFYRVDGVEKER